jgi:hypothetical protein
MPLDAKTLSTFSDNAHKILSREEDLRCVRLGSDRALDIQATV